MWRMKRRGRRLEMRPERAWWKVKEAMYASLVDYHHHAQNQTVILLAVSLGVRC